MFKTFALSLPLAVAVLGSTAVMAANDASTLINIRADIPTQQFHAQPLDPNFGRDEVMTFNTVTSELSQLSTVYALKNTGGSIDAYLQDGPASLTNGTQSIPLTISLGTVALDGTPKEVAADEESNPGLQRTMTIRADKPTAAQTGRFTAVATVIFDNNPRTVTP
ncbi:fimbrial protein [Pseudomonas sp. O64]|uniref:fimbrial protein n=1 Tax=unclassified Pseudomonas TaxID=196821 RepID=UPI0021D9175C|nr:MULTISPECIES: fimbrial protein [unclassified Pseudomonas]MCV2229372.1 fimbrial protein [Pseudomonas sp. AU10]UXZ23972.1 fimbrial protein [Pseudomonas sp. YeP6b]